MGFFSLYVLVCFGIGHAYIGTSVQCAYLDPRCQPEIFRMKEITHSTLLSLHSHSIRCKCERLKVYIMVLVAAGNTSRVKYVCHVPNDIVPYRIL